MKKTILALTVLTLVGCDPKHDISKGVGGVIEAPRAILRDVVGEDKNNDTKQDQQIQENSERIEVLEFVNDLQYDLIELNASNIQANSEDIEAIEAVLASIQSDVSDLESKVDANYDELSEGIEDLNGDLEDLESFVRRNARKLRSFNRRLNRLSKRDKRLLRRIQRSERAIRRLRSVVDANGVEVLNPCGAQGSHDEVLLKYGSTVIAYFKANGSREFLTVLKPNVSYTTTDGFRCHFKIDQNGDIIGNR